VQPLVFFFDDMKNAAHGVIPNIITNIRYLLGIVK
jgi:hypothetical protein